jgi:pimeloyl-ACP methyl ester carboxylesterase
MSARPGLPYTETWVDRDTHRMYVRDYPGEEPTIVLMHGFPDDLHLYDRLVPHLNPPRRVVTFDFLGWGASDKPAGYPYTADNQTGTWMPSSGNSASITWPSWCTTRQVARGIDWALDHADRVAA